MLHETKDEIVEVFKTVLPRLGKPAKISKSDCAAEYNTPQLVKLLKEHGVIEFRHSNEHGQAANGIVEKFGDIYKAHHSNKWRHVMAKRAGRQPTR